MTWEEFGKTEMCREMCRASDKELKRLCHERPSALRTAILEATIKRHGIKIEGLE